MIPIWFLISDEAREKLKAAMPKGWKPPRLQGKPVKLDLKLEDVEEIGKLMRVPTKRKGRP